MNDPKPNLPRPAASELFVEWFEDPFTGWTMLGVGAEWSGPACPGSFEVEVRYDAIPKAQAPVTQTAAGGTTRFRFAVHLPREEGVGEFRVLIRGEGAEEVELFRGRAAELPKRGEVAAPSPLAAGAERLAGPLVRALGSVARGEIVSLWRWAARLRRWREKLVRVRAKIGHKLLMRKHRPRSPHDGYVDHTKPTRADREAIRSESQSFPYRPRISVLLPVYNVDPKWLRAAVESVRAQSYDNWELCIADDASPRKWYLPFGRGARLRRYLMSLKRLAKRDPRIKVVLRAKNGHISACSNSAAALATGDFVALLDHDDCLAPDTLFKVAELLQRHADADVIYSDEDKIDGRNQRYDPQFKPDWSPDLLLAYNYFNHLTVIRKSLFDSVGRFRPGYEGSQDHDLLLRCVTETDRVHHVPGISYHWRALPESTACAATVKTYVHTSGQKALRDHLARLNVPATIYVPEFAQRLGLPINLLDWPDCGPSVAVLIPADDPEAFRRCSEALRASTAYRDYRIVPVPPAEPGEPLAARFNAAVRPLTEDLLLFLDPALAPAGPDWISRLAGYLSLPGAGATGARILSADGKLVHAGVVLGMRDGIAPANAFHGRPADEVSYYFLAEVSRTVSAVSGCCLLTRRRDFDRLGGFDEGRFGRTLFDVDYCLRLAKEGLRTVYVAGAELVTGVSAADRADDPFELLAFKETYGRPRDPYHNPSFSERDAFRPACDAPLSLRTESDLPRAKVLFAAHNLNNPEGAPRYLYEIAVGLKERGRVEPALFSPVAGPGEAAYARAGIPVHVGDLPEAPRFVDCQWNPLDYAAAQARLGKLLRRLRPEVVVANTLVSFPLVEAAARAGIPAVWIVHESYAPAHMAGLFSPYGRFRCEACFALAARVVPASHDTAARFAHLNTRGNFVVLHNGLEAGPFDDYLRRMCRAEAERLIPGPPGRKRIVAVGTVCERKGQHTLVEAAARLHQHRSDFCCYLVGMRDHIPYASYVRNLVRQHRLEDVVQLVAEVEDVRPFLRAADVFACTSHMEAFSRAILEAEAFGLPIVSTPCPGVSEQVFWDFNAFRFEPNDSNRLAAHLERLLSDDGLREQMARRSRAAFDNHLSYAEMLDRYERVILSAAKSGPRARLPWRAPEALAAVELKKGPRQAA